MKKIKTAVSFSLWEPGEADLDRWKDLNIYFAMYHSEGNLLMFAYMAIYLTPLVPI